MTLGDAIRKKALDILKYSASEVPHNHHASAADAQLSITPICSFSDVEAADVIDFSDEKRTDKLTDDSVDNVEMKKIRDAAIHHDGQESHLLKQFLK
ncbi:hypothetical protein GX50_06462 [[Emmonsia] crescens]|uniref:Uncharacterized protein n=1 Tax=[Emmonsia] crescens TaxID=73230 RepID=A0A2B7ZD84_9EURO|nr:hypothetical protein GX50_06462 [Emmonsia crescens]